MFMVGPYLFSGDKLDEYLSGRRAAALEAVKELPAEKLADSPRDALVEVHKRYSIPVTNLHADTAHFTGERQLTGEECEAIGASPDDAEKFKAISIAIPFTGDEHLFTCTPAIYSAHQPQAEVKDGELHVTYFLSETEEFQLEQNFKRNIALIERTLEVTQWQAMTHNEQLMDALNEAISARAGAQ